MRVLMLTHSFNSMAQRLWVELEGAGHKLSVEFDINDAVTRQAVALWRPDVVLAPILKRAIPADVFTRIPCLIVHPGPPGDRGPAALDRAILDGTGRWGVTVIEAASELDGGPVWAWREFDMRSAPKSSIYRREVVEAAVAAVDEALTRLVRGHGPQRSDNLGRSLRPALAPAERAVDWSHHTSEQVLARVRSADSQPGLLGSVAGCEIRLHDAWPATRPEGWRGQPGDWIGRAGEALQCATVDGAVWIGHLGIRLENSHRLLKLPAVTALEKLGIELPPEIDDITRPGRVAVAEGEEVTVIRFPFLNGAMNPRRSRELEQAIRAAVGGPARVIVLSGGEDFWCNGIDLATIEAADSPADASWEAIHAIDDVCLAMLERSGKWLVAALCGNAGAGGVFMALAADQVLARSGVVLNPHYRNMGNLYGSEYWTYLLPRRLGPEGAAALMANRLPLGADRAAEMGLIDGVLPGTPGEFEHAVIAHAEALARSSSLDKRIRARDRQRAADEQQRPLAEYRAAELERMKLNFFGFDTSYHVARYDFITKTPESRTPLYLARHRRSASGATGWVEGKI